MPQDWRDVRFDTGAKFKENGDEVNKIVQQGSVTYLPWYPSYPEVPTTPPDEANPDPGGEPGQIFIDFETGDLIIINGDGEATSVSLPDWFVLTDLGSGTHQVEVFATLLNLILHGLPSSDPGGGKVWLSAS